MRFAVPGSASSGRFSSGRSCSEGAARADALFASALQRSDEPTARQIEHAIAAAIRAFGDQGCVARVAQEFGEHPETAVARMRWARSVCDRPLALAS